MLSGEPSSFCGDKDVQELHFGQCSREVSPGGLWVSNLWYLAAGNSSAWSVSFPWLRPSAFHHCNWEECVLVSWCRNSKHFQDVEFIRAQLLAFVHPNRCLVNVCVSEKWGTNKQNIMFLLQLSDPSQIIWLNCIDPFSVSKHCDVFLWAELSWR